MHLAVVLYYYYFFALCFLIEPITISTIEMINIDTHISNAQCIKNL